MGNVKYFNNAMFKEFYQQISMKVAFASLYHPQSNRAVKKANSLIFEPMKKILEGEKKGKWAEVMPTTVWSHNTIVYRASNFTVFWLMYGAEAMLPEEIEHRSLQATTDSTPCPIEVEDKDLLDSSRLKVVTNLEKYQEETRAWRDPKVKLKQFEVKKPGAFSMRSHGEHMKFQSKVDRTLCGIRENEVRHLQVIRHSRKGPRTFLECREPSPFLHLSKNCRQRSREL
jgi:hypothetical protein